MTPIAIVMMCVAMLTLWGGLGLSILNLLKYPDQGTDEDE